MDLSRAYQEAKSLPDDALARELSQPSGMMPGYIVMTELADRKAMRSGGTTKPKGKAPSLAEELIQSMKPIMPQQEPVQGFSEGGILAKLNPFQAYLDMMQSPEMGQMAQQEAINMQHGNQPPLSPLQRAMAPGALIHTSTLRPTHGGTPDEPPRYASGGLASLLRR